LTGWVRIDGQQIEVEDWWSCRDHSWGVRERVGIPEPVTSPPSPRSGGLFAFLFYSTDTVTGHLQVTRSATGVQHMTAEITDRATQESALVEDITIDAEFVDEGRPRRVRKAHFDVRLQDGSRVTVTADAQGSPVAMQGLGYGGYADGLGLGVWRGLTHLETDRWDVSHPAEVRYPEGTTDRPVHRIQPVRVLHTAANGAVSEGTGSLTFIAELPLEELRRPS
jgi:hypothetical protein